MFNSTQDLVRIAASKLGYTLTEYRIEDVTIRVENSTEVLKFSNELTLEKVCNDLKYFILPSLSAFMFGLGVSNIIQAKSENNYFITQISIEQSVVTGSKYFWNTFSILFSIELIWLMSNLFLEKKASNKMILHFLQIREDVRK